ncbi:helix-turn-helix domain-containing protein [Streptomyces sp. NPDC047009]|uniref:TetR/AcrR family transcriptional regulator n=1 Tax=unclassified Streptomyces TaxID=2593676 RepID=UPI0033F33B88
MTVERARRADARRNAQAVIDAARTLFAEQGVDVPMEQIGKAAGIGKGTLYRHFPTRDHLFAAVSRDRFNRLTAAAESLNSDLDDPLAALCEWLQDFDRSAQHYRGMRVVVSVGIADDGSAIFASCQAMTERADALLHRAKEAGQVRPEIDIRPLLSTVAALPERFRDADGASELLPVIIRGICTNPR